MSPRRNIGPKPTRPRHIARVAAALGLAAAALTGSLTACADSPTSPATPRASAVPSLGRSDGTTSTHSYTISQRTVGDTVVTQFVVGTDASRDATFDIGDHSEISFPYAAGSICDPATSTYGATEWDKPCAAAQKSITITAKQWYGTDGLPRTDFQPALRFVPGLRAKVTLSLRDREGTGFGPRIDFCSAAGCVNEAAADPTLTTSYDATNGWWTRVVKHFSGYNVIAL